MQGLSSLDVAWPPRKQRGGADEVRTGLQRDAALRLGILQGLDVGEVPIDQHRVGERPQMLGRLQLGRMGWQEQQVHVLRHAHLGADVPARAIKHEHDLLGRTRPHLLGERFEFHREQFNVHGRRQMPHGATRGRMHETDQVAPIVPMFDGGNRILTG